MWNKENKKEGTVMKKMYVEKIVDVHLNDALHVILKYFKAIFVYM